VASQRIETLAKQQRAAARIRDSASEPEIISRTPAVEDPDASTKPKHPEAPSKLKPKSKSTSKTKSLAAAVKELEQSLSSTSTSSLGSETPTAKFTTPSADVTASSTTSAPKSSKKHAVKKTAQKGPVMAARKEMADPSASASKPRPDDELEDESGTHCRAISQCSREDAMQQPVEPPYILTSSLQWLTV
jgi:hypothetical protein